MKLRKILLGTDFSDESEVALSHALRLSRHLDAELILAHAGTVLDSDETALAPESPALAEYERILADHVAENRGRLAELSARVRAEGITASELLLDGFADTALADAAEQVDADLVVIGTHGRTGLKRLLLGSVAERVVRLCRRHVMVARTDTTTADRAAPGYRNILVPIDFTARSEAALELAIELLDPGGKVELLHGWHLPALSGSMVPGRASEEAFEPVKQSIEAGAREKAEALIARHAGRVPIELTIVHETPARAIDHRSAGHDLIVMGGHGRRGIRRWLLGSVAEATVRHAECSVLVVHDRAEAPAD